MIKYKNYKFESIHFSCSTNLSLKIISTSKKTQLDNFSTLLKICSLSNYFINPMYQLLKTAFPSEVVLGENPIYPSGFSLEPPNHFRSQLFFPFNFYPTEGLLQTL